MAYRDNLSRGIATSVFYHKGLLISVFGFIAQFLQKCGMPIVGMLNLVFLAGTAIDDEVFILLVFAPDLHIRTA